VLIPTTPRRRSTRAATATNTTRGFARNLSLQLKFKEVPIKVRYTEYSLGKIHKQSLINGIKTLYKWLEYNFLA